MIPGVKKRVLSLVQKLSYKEAEHITFYNPATNRKAFVCENISV